jgi:hypothetical protein
MKQEKKYMTTNTAGSAVRRKDGYLLMNLLLFLFLPLLSMISELYFEHRYFTWALIGKWIIFWAVGIRLFTAGISQSSNPAFTARIFNMSTVESYVVIRELGFSNIALGVIGILSAINDCWRSIAAISGCLFFGLAGIQHLLKKPDTGNEVIAMTGDLFVFTVLILYLVFTISF